MNGWWPYGHGGLLPAPRRLASLALRRSGSSRLPPCGQKRPPAFATRPPQQRRPSSPKQPLWLRRPGCRCGGWKPAPACAKPEPRFGEGRPAGEGRPGGGSFGEGRPPQRPASGFQIPRTPISGSRGRPWWGSKRPFGLCRSRVWFTWQRPGTFCLAQDPFIRAWHGPCGKIAGDPGGLVGPPPPSATSPGRRVAVSSNFLKHRTRACTWYRPSFCPDYRASGDGGGAAGKPVPARPCPGHGFRRAVRTRLDRAGGPRPIHPGGRRIRNLGRK